MLICAVLLVGAVSAANIPVKPSDSIQNKINTAKPGDTLSLSKGTYKQYNITIKKNLTITGPTTTGTPTATINARQKGNIFNIPKGVKANLKYLTITNGESNSNVGGISNKGKLTVTQCYIIKNRGNSGGGIYNNGTMIVTSSNINQNTADWDGGGIYNDRGGTITITDSNINNNTAILLIGYPNYGGGIFNWGGTVTVTNSNINHNIVTNIYGSGGGITNWFNGTVTVINSNIKNNFAWNDGGGIYNAYGTVTLKNSNINSNTVNKRGGGIRNSDGTVTVTGSNIKGNTAGMHGGGIYNSRILTVTGCDFESNKATGNGNAIYNYGVVSSVVNFNRFNNPNKYEIYCESGAVNAKNNWWGSNSNPSNKIYGNVTISPWLVSLSQWQEHAKRLPDLVVQSISGPTAGYNDKTISVTNTVKNIGPTAAGKFYTRFYLSKDTKFTSKDIYLGQRTINSLKAGSTSTAKTNLKIPAKTAKGTYYLIAVADATKKIKESTETNNNKYTGKISIQSSPDLTITSLTGPKTGTRGKTIQITNTIKNTGTTTAGKFYTKFYLSKDTKFTSNDIYLGQRTINSLKAGAKSTAKTSLKIPAKTAKGIYHIIAITDATKKIIESSETNNNKYTTKKTTIK